jgi:glycosyltransferase involved in cell wall biosynthesis
MKVLFYASNHRGHYFSYLAKAMPAFLECGVQVSLAASPEAFVSPEFDRCLQPFGDQIQQVKIERLPSSPLRNAFQRARQLRRIVREQQPDHLWVLYADGLWQIVTLLGKLGYRVFPAGLTTEAWMYRGKFTYPGNRSPGALLRRGLFRQALRRDDFTKLHLDDELLFEFASRVTSRRVKTVLTPNPVESYEPVSTTEARRKMSLPDKGYYIGITGMISGFKGVPQLLDAFTELMSGERIRADTFLLLAGPQHPEIRMLLTRSPYAELVEKGKLISIDRFLGQREMFLATSACDLIAAVYPSHSGRSSIILWAAAAGRPVLGSAKGCIGYVVEKQRLGSTVDPTDHVALCRAVATAINQPYSDDMRANARRYAQTHSLERYRETATRLVRERLGQAAPNH